MGNAENPSWYQLVPLKRLSSIEDVIHIAWHAKCHASCVPYGRLFNFIRMLRLTDFVLYSRLPVRALLFQCAICHHGGHQACYRQYYLQQPMVDLPTTFLPPSTDSRGRSSIRPAPSIPEDDSSSMLSMQSSLADTQSHVTESPVNVNRPGRLAGHPCAAGCGHFCWAANQDTDEV